MKDSVLLLAPGALFKANISATFRNFQFSDHAKIDQSSRGILFSDTRLRPLHVKVFSSLT